MKLGQWLGLFAIAIALYVLWQSRQLLLLLFTAAVLAIAVNRLVRLFQRLPLQRGWAILLSIGLLAALLGGMFALILPPFIDQFQALVDLLPVGFERIETSLRWLERRVLEPTLPGVSDLDGLLEQLTPTGSNLLAQAVSFFSTSINAVLELLLVLVLMLMFLANPQAYRQVLIRLFPSYYRSRMNEVLERCEVAIIHWTVGALTEMVFVGVISGIGLWLLQVPLALAHAVLAGLLNFIPNIGPTLSVLFPITIALLDAPWKALAVLILYLLIQQIESYWLTPTIMAKQVALLPAITLSAQIFFANLFGVLGLLIALPLTVVAKICLEEVLFKDILDTWQRPPSYE